MEKYRWTGHPRHRAPKLPRSKLFHGDAFNLVAMASGLIAAHPPQWDSAAEAQKFDSCRGARGWPCFSAWPPKWENCYSINPSCQLLAFGVSRIHVILHRSPCCGCWVWHTVSCHDLFMWVIGLFKQTFSMSCHISSNFPHVESCFTIQLWVCSEGIPAQCRLAEIYYTTTSTRVAPHRRTKHAEWRELILCLVHPENRWKWTDSSMFQMLSIVKLPWSWLISDDLFVVSFSCCFLP